MPFKKGTSGNPKGRPVNSKNKAAEDFRTKVKAFISENWDQVQKDFNSMDAEKRLAFLEKLLKYSIAPLSSVNVQADIKTRLETLTDEQLDQLADKLISLNTGNHEQQSEVD